MRKKQIVTRKGEYFGDWRRPFILAEMSGNHNQDFERGLAIIKAAAKLGADGIKLQTYTADTMTLDVNKKNGDFWIDEPDNNWSGTSLHAIFQTAYTPWDWHKPYMKLCKKLGLVCISTAFDENAVDFLEDLNVPFYKVASFENNHLPLIAYMARTKKPIVMSTGMATFEELSEAVQVARENGCKDLTLLKCTSAYPADASEANLASITHMRESLGVKVGLSDHSLGIGVAVAASTLGVCLIEKHLTLRRADGGVDSFFSMEPEEMEALVIESERAYKAVGQKHYGATKTEKSFVQGRRSVYIAKNTVAGEVLTRENLRVVRPGYGLHPRHYEMLLGTELIRDVTKGERASWDMVMKKKRKRGRPRKKK
ncbi:pseudaminic acid synthase [Pseudomonadota bacterium]